MKLSEAAHKGIEMSKPTTVVMFDKGPDGELEACFLGAALLGADLVTPEEALSTYADSNTQGPLYDLLEAEFSLSHNDLVSVYRRNDHDFLREDDPRIKTAEWAEEQGW